MALTYEFAGGGVELLCTAKEPPGRGKLEEVKEKECDLPYPQVLEELLRREGEKKELEQELGRVDKEIKALKKILLERGYFDGW